MDYKDKYNKLVEAVKVLQETNPSDEDIQNWVNDNVPELRESEDEKIRKMIINQMEEWHKAALENNAVQDIKDSADAITWLKKPADKVEPKFKVGDWVVYEENIYQIHNLSLKKYYECLRTDGTVHTFDFENIDSKSHFWTIQDAKDGDVLADEYGIYIFNSFNSLDDKLFICKCAYEYSKKVFEVGGMLCGKTDVYPASREQRDILFQKMRETGYTFDFEKKELKKIEQKPAEWKQENVGELSDFENAMMHIGRSFFGENAGLDPNDTDTIKEQAELLLELAPKTEWSEEDEKNSYHLKTLLESLTKDNKYEFRIISDNDRDKYTTWLESIKDRVHPQKQWKPSDEQMYTLEWFTTNVLDDGIVGKKAKEVLYTLIKQLKQL